MMKINVDNEYLCAVRTKSFADFFLHAQLLLLPSSPSDLLLNPRQETVASLLKSSGNSRELNSVLFDYFRISAEASRLCTYLLKPLIHLQTIYRNISNDKIIDPNTISGLLGGPLPSGLDRGGFEEVQERQGRVLQRLRGDEGGGGAAGCGGEGGVCVEEGFRHGGEAGGEDRGGGEVERDRAMVERGGCLEESEFGVSRQAEELEEHVYLCLLTINRARAMVVREICRSCMP
ncbi:hypothetical protein SASPL_149989 [Salvia splendens]|uniref:Uncharacterized protein n=1 Tax=Salvia splendens TaxID=180675 RepID=A0A8X8W6N1_SALSN|nr:hypothetical protein SASPL_149989 [Salvia splendens]